MGYHHNFGIVCVYIFICTVFYGVTEAELIQIVVDKHCPFHAEVLYFWKDSLALIHSFQRRFHPEKQKTLKMHHPLVCLFCCSHPDAHTRPSQHECSSCLLLQTVRRLWEFCLDEFSSFSLLSYSTFSVFFCASMHVFPRDIDESLRKNAYPFFRQFSSHQRDDNTLTF